MYITFQVIVITATNFSVEKIAYFLSESGAGFMTGSTNMLFSTMMSNLFAMRADLSSPDMKQWQNEYLQVWKGPEDHS